MKPTKKILRLYIDKFIKGSIKFEGLDLVPELNEHGIMEWSVNNPNNLSYTYNVVYNQIEDSLIEFESFLGYGGKSYTESRQSISYYNTFDFDNHISEELYNKLYNESLKTSVDVVVPSYRLNDGFYSDNCKIKLYHLNFNGEAVDMVVDLYLNLDVMNTKTNERIPDDEVREYVHESLEHDYENSGKFIDYIYNELDNVTSIITHDKRIYDYHTSFIDIATRIFYKGSRIY